MNHLTLISVAALSLSAAGQSLGEHPRVGQAETIVTGVEVAPAFEPGFVSIYGEQLGLVQQVMIDGQAMRMVRKSGREIVIDPGNMNPGFAALELVQPGRTIKTAIEFTPSLSATRNGNLVRISMNPGQAGDMWVMWSYRCLATPAAVPGVYYHNMLDLSVESSGLLFVDHSLWGEPMEAVVAIPPAVRGGIFQLLKNGWVAGGVDFQAYCALQQSYLYGGEQYLCFSNMVEVPLAGMTAP
jgi:hypothetical protein